MVFKLAGKIEIILAFCLSPSVEACAQDILEGQSAVGACCDIARPKLDWALCIGVESVACFLLEADCKVEFGILARRIGDVGVEETVALFDWSWSPLDHDSSPMARAGQSVALRSAYWIVS